MKKLVVLSGAGISAESGLETFRGAGGLWEGYNIQEVATPEAWQQNPDLVQRFYNMRRKACIEAQPNNAHQALVSLEKKFDVQIITQNIDDLHERAGSSNVLHLHGEIRKSQSSKNSNLVYDILGDELKIGDVCSLNSQLRPHVVWFGEPVPKLNDASKLIKEADILLIVGTSLQVYPAANLIYDAKSTCEIIVIDPDAVNISIHRKVRIINKKAGNALPDLAKKLTE